MKLQDINIRDPYIMVEGGKYYLYGTRGPECWGKGYGLDVYISEDMENWSEPVEVFTKTDDFWADRNFWAPEVHKYLDSYYMFVTFKSEDRCRGVQILKAEVPTGPFCVHSDGPVTPGGWECLDGTLYIENGTPYMIFCHEWLQVNNGEMCAIELSKDLRRPIGEPILLFRAKDVKGIESVNHADGYVTDGPFMHKTENGKLIMIWSSYGQDGYCEILSYAKDGTLLGGWHHDERMLFDKDGGHGMIFRDRSGKLRFTLHMPNTSLDERPVIFDLFEINDSLYVKSV